MPYASLFLLYNNFMSSQLLLVSLKKQTAFSLPFLMMLETEALKMVMIYLQQILCFLEFLIYYLAIGLIVFLKNH